MLGNIFFKAAITKIMDSVEWALSQLILAKENAKHLLVSSVFVCVYKTKFQIHG